MKRDYKVMKTIHLLSNNSRLSSKEVAKEIKSTQQNASYLINKLESEKKILNFKLLVDSSKFGFSNFCVFLRIKHYSKSKVNNFVNEIKKYKEIISIDFLFGNFDIFLRFATPNASNFNKIFKDILNSYPNMILDNVILTQIVLYNYPLNYLSKKRFNERIIISGDREIINIDEMDKKIINELNNNSRTNYSYIANKINTTSKTVIQRVKNMVKKNIIRGFSIMPNHKTLNINRYYLLLKLDFEDAETEKSYNYFVQQQTNITEHIKVFGLWDSILIVESLDTEDFKKILYVLKEQYSDFIINYTFYESEEVKLWKYIPEL